MVIMSNRLIRAATDNKSMITSVDYKLIQASTDKSTQNGQISFSPTLKSLSIKKES